MIELDKRLRSTKITVRGGVCVLIPKGTQITLCGRQDAPGAKKVWLTSSWYTEVRDVEPAVALEEPTPKALGDYSTQEILSEAMSRMDPIKAAGLQAAIAAYLRGD